ncbi:hypothetical protein HK096_007917 [Nowakowskiella sp. JEL0078]|nr:hypothetical protein HK096_007917 [Nowakowskiella sp. JEL0078]
MGGCWSRPSESQIHMEILNHPQMRVDPPSDHPLVAPLATPLATSLSRQQLSSLSSHSQLLLINSQQRSLSANNLPLLPSVSLPPLSNVTRFNKDFNPLSTSGPQTIVTESSAGNNALKYTESNAIGRRRWPQASYIIGLDFGTTFSGFSVMPIPSDGSEPRKVLCCTNWRDQPPRVASPKVPTVLNYSVTPAGTSLTHWGWTVDAVPMEPHLRRVERVKLLLGGLGGGASGLSSHHHNHHHPGGLSSASNHNGSGNHGVAYHPGPMSDILGTGSEVLGAMSATSLDSGLGVSRVTMSTAKGKIGTPPPAHLDSLIFRNVTLPGDLTPKQVIADYLGCLKEIFLQMIEKDQRNADALRFDNKSRDTNKEWENAGEIRGFFIFVSFARFLSHLHSSLILLISLIFFNPLIVPVFWTQAHMQVMREAAVLAGLIPKVNSDLLTFCHEPVAAALSFVRSPKILDRLNRGLGGSGSKTPHGSRALIVDAGGGTVDLFQCTIQSPFEISEVTQAAGDFFGASLVDAHFWTFFESQIGTLAFELLQHDPELRQSYRTIMVQWDSIKREFRDDESCWSDPYTGGYKAFVLSRVLCEVIEDEVAAKLPARGSEVRITLDDMKRFFDPAVDKIVKMVGDQLEAIDAPIDYLFMVGGFCANGYLVKRVVDDKRVQGRFREVPELDQPDGAVLEGAAWFAWNSNVVVRRKAGRTLGVKIGRPFDPARDSVEEVVNVGDPRERWTVYKRFHVFVRKGDPVDHGATYTRDNFTIMGGKPTVDVVVYSCILPDLPRDITVTDFEIVGKVTVDLRRWGALGASAQDNTGHKNTTNGMPTWVDAPDENCDWWDPRKNTFRIEIEYGNVELWVRARPNGVVAKVAEELEFRMAVAVDEVL